MPPTTPRPDWFEQAVGHEPEIRRVDSDGCPVNYLCWGPSGAPGLVFIHGGAAHAHWWSFLVPHLADHYRVVALDLSGHGDSGRRDHYPLDSWPTEVMDVVDDALARFRTVPEQDHYLPYVMDHVGRHSLHEVDGR